MNEAPVDTLARTFVVDSSRRICESTVPELCVGELLTASSWLGEPALDAMDAAALAGCAQRWLGRDLERGTHWILHASIVGTDPWRARVVAVDATPAVLADREAVFSKLVHALTNISFALSAVLDVTKVDRPTGERLDEYLAHLNGPVRRLSTITQRLAASLPGARGGSPATRRSLGAPCYRDKDAEGRGAADRRGELDARAVLGRQLLGDREPESGP